MFFSHTKGMIGHDDVRVFGKDQKTTDQDILVLRWRERDILVQTDSDTCKLNVLKCDKSPAHPRFSIPFFVPKGEPGQKRCQDDLQWGHLHTWCPSGWGERGTVRGRFATFLTNYGCHDII